MADSFQPQLPIKPDQILEIIIRRRWFIIIPICITLTLGLFITFTIDKTYEASTLILVQPQRVPANYIKSVVTSSISQRLSTISQQILSRSNLEKIIYQFGLFEDEEKMYLEDKIAIMRKRVQVKIERARYGAEAFSIAFKGNDPQRVMQVANTLASFFMDENLKVREAQAVGTSEFLDAELQKTRKKLEDREKKVADYRTKYIGGLPDELNANLRTLDRLQDQLKSKQELLTITRNSLNILETQIAQSKEMASQSFDDKFSSFDFEEGAFEGSENEQKLSLAKEQYDNLLLKYTEKHPDVAKVKKIIEKLEKTIKEEKKVLETGDSEGETGAIEDIVDEQDLETGMPNFAAIQQEMQLKQIKNEIRKIQSDIFKIEQQMKVYEKRVEDTPKRELELQSLQRDYASIQSVFNSLLDRRLEAELSVNMEKKQKGEQFRIIDHARLPEKPISPSVAMLFLLSVASGIGTGFGVIFLLEAFNTSIRREEQIEKNLGLTILAAIPILKKPGHKIKTKVEMVAFACVTIYATLFLSFFVILNFKGLDRTIDFIKSNLNF
ncbi:GumC family protein [Desulfobacula toluolica]|uniref:Lipopolysaccharide biosynthesis protein n=1 Tax=Desulfobacula toluolica (strain DSM 7467 / Tol2) TaxID=651182 RepID=K0NKN1_DESTT|nr:Wzz/FepE/Etk N-terminal domain-containing protein [Desulfobacula toluolica]CCK80498.1 lipopolysaccharide biosynthesis protein [Desulfobacula toluolica Tol2]